MLSELIPIHQQLTKLLCFRLSILRQSDSHFDQSHLDHISKVHTMASIVRGIMPFFAWGDDSKCSSLSFFCFIKLNIKRPIDFGFLLPGGIKNFFALVRVDQK